MQSANLKSKLVVLGTIILTLIICIPPVLSTLVTAENTISAYGSINYIIARPLHIEGKNITDDLGRVIYLRGVNVGFLDSTAGHWVGQSAGNWDEAVVRTNLQEMQKWGINHVRLLCSAAWWIDNANDDLYWDGNTGINYRDAIERTIEIASEYGIYVVIDFYNVVAGAGPEHMPIPPYQQQPSSSDYFPTVQSWVDFWVQVATWLGGYSNVLFDMWNEPAEGDIAVWFSAVQQAINATRAIPRDNIIFVQWGYCGSVDWLRRSDLPTGVNVAYSQHIYRAEGTFPNNEYTYDDVYDVLYNFRDYGYATENNVPLWIGEIGAAQSQSPTPEELAYFNNTLNILNEWKIEYSGWSWRANWAWALVNSDFSPTVAGEVFKLAIT